MAEEQQGQEKTEEPTQRKREKARREGQAARSRELNSMSITVGGALLLLGTGPWMASRIHALARWMFEHAAGTFNPMAVLAHATRQAVAAVAPMLGLLVVVGALSSVALGGLVLSGKAIAFKANRLSPLQGFKRMFSAKSMMELAKSLAKFGLISGVAVLILALTLPDTMRLGTLAPVNAVHGSLTQVGLALVLIALSLVLVAAADVPFEMAQFRKQLKMTKQEVKDELKDTEGKPEVRSRIRQLQYDASQRRMLDNVPKADVVITNPEHYAVAVRYDAETEGAPSVVAKGVDFMALRIREVAATNGIEIIGVPPLARALFYTVAVDREIPSELYVAVAQVLAYVYQLRQYRSGVGGTPPRLGGVDVPEGFER